MIKYNMPKLEIEKDITFDAIPDEKFDETMEELDKRLSKKMLENKIMENESIEISKHLVFKNENRNLILKK